MLVETPTADSFFISADFPMQIVHSYYETMVTDFAYWVDRLLAAIGHWDNEVVRVQVSWQWRSLTATCLRLVPLIVYFHGSLADSRD